MNNMEKEFVPYELSVKLKELGCHKTFSTVKKEKRFYVNIGGNETDEFYFVDNTVEGMLYQQAFDWFRDIKGLPVSIGLTIDNKGYTFLITNLGKIPKVDYLTFPDELDYGTYEQSRLACLEKLIELIQNK